MTMLAAVAVLASCLDKGVKVPFEEVNISAVEKDTMIYGFCTSGTTKDRIHIITDAGDTLMLRVASARQDSLVIGGYATGDEVAVAVNADTTEATMVVNKTALYGNWVMPNPIDGSSVMGMSILKGGMAESIDQSEVLYKSWRLFNGKLIFVIMREDGIGNEETMWLTIKKLTRDSLIVKDDEETMEYSRPKPVEDDTDIELDDGMDDFFL